jgi:hypothetical protein
MRLCSESPRSLTFRIFSELGTGWEYPAEAGPNHSRRSVRTFLFLFFAIALAGAVALRGSWRSANSSNAVRFPPAEWASQPPQWID